MRTTKEQCTEEGRHDVMNRQTKRAANGYEKDNTTRKRMSESTKEDEEAHTNSMQKTAPLNALHLLVLMEPEWRRNNAEEAK